MELKELYFYARLTQDYDMFLSLLSEIGGFSTTDSNINNLELSDLCDGDCKKITDIAKVLEHHKCKCLD